MEELKSILEQFDSNREKSIYCVDWEQKSVEEKYNAVAEWFRPCAKQILCNGYFLINGKYIIDLGSIELYYHEEEGSIKDYIMYHINDNKKIKTKIKEQNEELPYFKFGSFNLHQSGVDVTFENEEKKYRASFLIRAYRVLIINGGLYPENDDTKYDPHSTHIFDDMFFSGISFNNKTEIMWIPTDRKGGEIELLERVNVATYENVDIKKEAKDADYLKEKSKYLKVKNKYYERDMRSWRFQLKNIKKEK